MKYRWGRWQGWLLKGMPGSGASPKVAATTALRSGSNNLKTDNDDINNKIMTIIMMMIWQGSNNLKTDGDEKFGRCVICVMMMMMMVRMRMRKIKRQWRSWRNCSLYGATYFNINEGDDFCDDGDEDGGGNRELDGYNNDDDEDMKMASHLGRSAWNKPFCFFLLVDGITLREGVGRGGAPRNTHL